MCVEGVRRGEGRWLIYFFGFGALFGCVEGRVGVVRKYPNKALVAIS